MDWSNRPTKTNNIKQNVLRKEIMNQYAKILQFYVITTQYYNLMDIQRLNNIVL